MAAPGRQSFEKRLRERKKKEKQQEKAERKAQRKADKESGLISDDMVDLERGTTAPGDHVIPVVEAPVVAENVSESSTEGAADAVATENDSKDITSADTQTEER